MGSSIREHRFGATLPFTIGVEEEYMLLDPVTYDLVQRADRLLSLEDDIELGVHLAPPQLQYIAWRELVFGLHVRVAVDGAGKAVYLMGALVRHLPEQTGCIGDYTHIWWDGRPHPRLGTLEVRVMDAVSRIEDAVAIAAYVQGVVKLYAEAYDAGERLPDLHRALATESKWLAARYGLEAPLIDPETGSRIRVSAAKLVRRTLAAVEPHARELGSGRELEGLHRILLDGNGSEEQLRVFRDTRDVVEVTREIARPALVAA